MLTCSNTFINALEEKRIFSTNISDDYKMDYIQYIIYIYIFFFYAYI